MKRLIGLVGYAGTGKDTVADYLSKQHGFSSLASGDLVREVLYAANPWVPLDDEIPALGMYRLQEIVDFVGWDRAKREHPEVRRLLQDMGTEGVRKVLGADVWIDETLRLAKAAPTDVCVTDTRFPNEAAKVVVAGGHIWRIERPGVGPVNEHSSETMVAHIPADATILNDGTLEDLYARIDAELEKVPPYGGRTFGPPSAWGRIPGQRQLPGHLIPQPHRSPRGFTGGPLHIDVI